MHPTSSTILSATLGRLENLQGRLHHASFIPQEELLGLLVAGSLVIQRLAEETETTQFTEEEVALVEEVSSAITSELENMYGLDFGDTLENEEGDSYDDSPTERRDWDYPEWDN